MYRKIVSCLLCIFILFNLLSGCRPSTALQEVIYEHEAENENNDSNSFEVENEKDNEDIDEDLSPKDFNDESSDLRERQRNDATQGDNESDLSAPSKKYEDTVTHEFDVATSSTEIPDKQDAYGSIDIGGDYIETVTTNLDRKAIDLKANRTEIPENVKSLSAVGEAANVVRILGGVSKLVATSESFNSDLIENSDNVSKILWKSQGKSYLSDDDFNLLLELKPEVCIEISGDMTFSDSQIKTLENNGIKYVVLPSFTTDSGIMQSVEILGIILGQCDNIDANKKASDYLDFVEKVQDLVSDKTEAFFADGYNYDTEKSISNNSSFGVYTLFINGWDYSAKYKLHDDAYITLEGSGLPVARTGYKYSPITYYLALAGVSNTSALMENNYSIYESKLKYVNPIVSPNKTLSVNSLNYLVNDTTRSYTSAGGNYLGEEFFKSIVVANTDIKNNLLENSLWKNYGKTYSLSGLTNGYGFTDENGDIVRSSIHGDYEILVLPDGVGSWSNGSVESFFVSLWATTYIRHLTSENELKSYVKDFYDEFYNIKLSNKTLNEILMID